uniref:PHD finger protein 7 n=1 Tax=Accipiter nisus TaxID=211598 RepID=A0A8B9RSI8_9AVES
MGWGGSSDPAWQGQSGPVEGKPSTRAHLHALERSSALVAFALLSAVCVLCGRADADPDIYGEKSQDNGVCTHENCLVSFPGAAPSFPLVPQPVAWALHAQPRRIEGWLLRFLQICYVCGKRGATITCYGKKCKNSFHFPCGHENGCVSQFFGQYRSFCQKHRPAQTVQAHQDSQTSCIICLEHVEEKLSYQTMVCPSCRQAWFHRGCIQQQAFHAGLLCFRCPQCNDREKFLPEMSSLGIQVPARQPAWEAGAGFTDMYQRHSRCDASLCLYAQGREQAEEEGPWYLLLCSSCAAKGTHRRCSALQDITATWECEDCAGVSTGKSRL